MSMTNFQMITIKIERVANFEVFQFRRCWCWRSGYFLPLKATTSQSPPKSRREPWRVPRSKTGSWTQRLQTGGSWTQRLQNKKHTFCPVHNISVGFLSSVFKISAGFQTFSRQTDSHVQINRTSIFTQHTVCWKFYTHVKVNSDERKKMELTIFRRKIRYKYSYKLEWKEWNMNVSIVTSHDTILMFIWSISCTWKPQSFIYDHCVCSPEWRV